MSIEFRPALEQDSSNLAILADAATRRLSAWLWDESAATGQSSFEVGRETIRSNNESLSHHARWEVALHQGQFAGGLNSYQMPPVTAATSAYNAQVLAPLNYLKAVAEGTWYVSVASVFPEFRGRGLGQAIIERAESLAVAADCDQLTLMVGSFNPGAFKLYERLGMREWKRGPFNPFPGSDPDGHWILMVKDLP